MDLGTACVLAASLVTAGSNHADIADAVRNFPTKFSSARQTPALMRRRRQQANSLDFMQTKPAPLAWSTAWTRTSAFHSDSATTQHRVWGKESEGDGDKNGNDTPNSNAFQSDESVPTAARAGLHVLGALGGDSGGAAGGAAGGTTDGRLKTPTKNTGDAERRAGAASLHSQAVAHRPRQTGPPLPPRQRVCRAGAQHRAPPHVDVYVYAQH